jgi:carbon monoxide dehydrogenase subunit G
VQLTSAIRIGRPAPEVLDALLDAGTVAACLPGSRLIGEVADSTYAGELHLQIGPMRVVYTGTVRLDSADRDAGTATLRASGWERGGPGRADASVTLRVESRGATTRVLISADLTIRGQVAEYAPGAIGHVGQRLVEQFAGNVEQLLETQASGAPVSTGSVSTGPVSTGPVSTGPGGTRLVSTGPAPPGPEPPRVDRRLLAASALLLAGGALAAGALAAVAVWRRRHPGLSLPPDTPWYFSHEGARHG